MTILKEKYFIILKPDENKYIVTKDLSCIYEGEIYLSNFDSPKNYYEVDEDFYQRGLINNDSNNQ